MTHWPSFSMFDVTQFTGGLPGPSLDYLQLNVSVTQHHIAIQEKTALPAFEVKRQGQLLMPSDATE